MAGATERSALDDVDALPRELLAGSDPEAALVPVLEGLARAFGYERSLVALADERARTIRGRFGRGIADQMPEASSRRPAMWWSSATAGRRTRSRRNGSGGWSTPSPTRSS